jgi:hypothetical protein
MKLSIACMSLLTLCLAVVPAFAQQDLYDNGPTNGTVSGWTFNLGFTPSDSFTLNSSATVNGLQFAAWLMSGDVLQSAEVSITSDELGGTVFFDQTVNFIQSGCVTNQLGFNVCDETGSLSPTNLNAGTYWLTLQNGVVSNGNDPVYWDQNGGPSEASETSLGSIPSESFTILGSGSGTGTTPEPSSIVLFASAIGAFQLVRRKFSV